MGYIGRSKQQVGNKRRKEDDLPGYKNDHKHYKKSDGGFNQKMDQEVLKTYTAAFSRHRRSKLEYKYQDSKTKTSSSALEAPWMSFYFVVFVLIRNILVDLPEDVKCIGVKWVFKTKINERGEVEKHKSQLLACGYGQEHRVDYLEVYASIARIDTIRLLVAIAAQRGWAIYQMDVKSVFLHGTLQENVYVQQPQGYIINGKEHMVYKLHKAFDGLKQAPKAWFSRIETYFLMEGNDRELLEDFKESMKAEFEMSDMGKMRYFLGIEVVQTPAWIHMNQRKYAAEILSRFDMESCNAVVNPIVLGCKLRCKDGESVDETLFKQLVGSLMYITITRPAIQFVVSLISRFMSKPTSVHLAAAKRIMRYIQGTLDCGIWYKMGGEGNMKVFNDSDYAGDFDDRKSTSCHVILWDGAAVIWSSKKQSIVALSSTEAEYVATAACACQVIWVRGVLQELGLKMEETTMINCDNTSAIKLSQNPVFHGRLVDIFTKPLHREVFLKLRDQLGVCSLKGKQDTIPSSLREGLLE
ncbi:retrovirus-related pol polyprotein from transposon TNT 1-94 [Tanacetum coccineum]